MTRARKQPPRNPKPEQLDLFDQRTRRPVAQSPRAAALAADASAKTQALRALDKKTRGRKSSGHISSYLGVVRSRYKRSVAAKRIKSFCIAEPMQKLCWTEPARN